MGSRIVSALPKIPDTVTHVPFEGQGSGMGLGWKRRRARQLRKRRVCQWPDCTAKATEVDHEIPRFEGGADTDENLQSLCHDHHSQKTAAEGRRAWAGKKKKLEARFDFTEQHPGLNTGSEPDESPSPPTPPTVLQPRSGDGQIPPAIARRNNRSTRRTGDQNDNR